MLKLEYPNLLVAGLPGKDNISDYLSRTMDLPSVVKRSILSKQIRIGNCEELSGEPMTLQEAENLISTMPDKHSFVTTPAPSKPAKEKMTLGEASCLLAIDDSTNIDYSKPENSSLSVGEKLLLDTLRPIKILSDRISIQNIKLAQQELAVHAELSLSPGKTNSSGIRYETSKGLLMFKDRIFIPADLEGVLLSYYHLSTGHVGQKKLALIISRKFYMPLLESKCETLVSACHACALNNPNRKRRALEGSVPIASYAFETVSLDFLEVVKNASSIKTILVITDHFSKLMMTYFLQSNAVAPVLEKLKEFLMYTGCATRYVLTDNGSPFSSAEFNKFLYILGIYKIKSTPYLSRARGQVEVCNRILSVMLRKLLLLSPRYTFRDILFLAPVFYNSGVHHSTKLAPYQIVYGTEPFGLGPLGGSVREPPKLFAESVREELSQLREAISERVATTVELLREAQSKYLIKENKHRKNIPTLKQGSIVFIKNYGNTQDTGERAKFRPNIMKSPFIVNNSHKNSVSVMRLADSFVTARHPNDIVVYKKELKKSHLFKDLGPEVWDILGAPLDE